MASESLYAEAERDRLTGLPDERALFARFDSWRAECDEGSPSPVHALLLGLGRFDTVNLAYGAAAGDGALVEVARRIQHLAADELLEGDWIAARLSGGTFALFARDTISRERWQWLGEAVAEAVAAPISAIEGAGVVRLWPRIALMRVLPGETGAHVLDRLAATLGRARDRAGARVLWADHLHTPAGIRAAELEADLLVALDRGEIEVAFQPQYSLADNRLVGAEALARWRHPRVGLIGAGALFTIAERADHVAQLSRHVAEVALAAAADWPDDLQMSLNVTPVDLADRSFARDFASLVAASGFPADRLTVEITEQALLADLEVVAPTLSALRATGMRIALDDFGGGFCNFRYLKLLALDTLKLDRSMIEGIDSDPRDRAVLRAIVALARALDLSVIAEGIETQEQRAVAAEEGCAIFQGFLGAKPLSPADFLALAC
ncbi:EAL domain-containing protein [Tsuneonella sp. HG094]